VQQENAPRREKAIDDPERTLRVHDPEFMKPTPEGPGAGHHQLIAALGQHLERR
jgi:hypothetical protein